MPLVKEVKVRGRGQKNSRKRRREKADTNEPAFSSPFKKSKKGKGNVFNFGPGCTVNFGSGFEGNKNV